MVAAMSELPVFCVLVQYADGPSCFEPLQEYIHNPAPGSWIDWSPKPLGLAPVTDERIHAVAGRLGS